MPKSFSVDTIEPVILSAGLNGAALANSANPGANPVWINILLSSLQIIVTLKNKLDAAHIVSAIGWGVPTPIIKKKNSLCFQENMNKPGGLIVNLGLIRW